MEEMIWRALFMISKVQVFAFCHIFREAALLLWPFAKHAVQRFSELQPTGRQPLGVPTAAGLVQEPEFDHELYVGEAAETSALWARESEDSNFQNEVGRRRCWSGARPGPKGIWPLQPCYLKGTARRIWQQKIHTLSAVAIALDILAVERWFAHTNGFISGFVFACGHFRRFCTGNARRWTTSQ